MSNYNHNNILNMGITADCFKLPSWVWAIRYIWGWSEVWHHSSSSCLISPLFSTSSSHRPTCLSLVHLHLLLHSKYIIAQVWIRCRPILLSIHFINPCMIRIKSIFSLTLLLFYFCILLGFYCSLDFYFRLSLIFLFNFLICIFLSCLKG